MTPLLRRRLARWIDNSPRIQVPVRANAALQRTLFVIYEKQVYVFCEPLSTVYMIALVWWVIHKNLEVGRFSKTVFVFGFLY